MVPTNPFFHRGPIRDRSYFFGRERLLARALGFLTEGQSVALVGPRRIGKTSLLFRLMEPHDLPAPFSPALRLQCCYFDCEHWGRLSAEQIYGLLADAVRQGLSADPRPREPVSFAAFERVVGQAVAQGIQPVLMLDEFEALSTNPALDNNFFAGLRALAMEHHLAYLTVSTQPLLALTYARVHPHSSPFFNFFALLRLGLFSHAESSALLQTLSARGGAPFTAPFCDRLIQGVGDHPFFLQMLGDYAFERVISGEPQHGDLVDTLLRGPFREEAADHWGAFWRHVSAEDQQLLALFPILAPSQPASVRRLEAAGLVVRADDGTPALVSQGFQAFVAAQTVVGVTQAPPLTLDPERRVVLLAGRPLPLSPQQFDLLAYLIAHHAHVVTHEELCAAIWQRTDTSSFESLRTSLKELRTTLGVAKHCLVNIRGQGYQFVPLDSSALPASPPTAV